MALSVIISTYNSPEWLKKVLWGYANQTFTDFEIIIADDGSTKETETLLNNIKKDVKFQIKHVWQKDKGFRKCSVLNLAIEASNNQYLVFSDGDCIPRNDFLETHYNLRREKHFLSGSYFKLPMKISNEIAKDDILSQNCFEITWLKNRGLKISKVKALKLSGKKYDKVLNCITPTNASWNGHNASGWKKDILAVNGFDTRMRYGGEDREFGERLMNNGIKPIQIRYSTTCVHLDHSRSYVNKKDLKINANIRKSTKRQKKTWSDYGIVKSDIR